MKFHKNNNFNYFIKNFLDKESKTTKIICDNSWIAVILTNVIQIW